MYIIEHVITGKIRDDELRTTFEWNQYLHMFKKLPCIFMFYNSDREVIYIGETHRLSHLKSLQIQHEEWFNHEVRYLRCFVFTPEENIKSQELRSIARLIRTKMQPRKNKSFGVGYAYKYGEHVANDLIILSDKKIHNGFKECRLKSINKVNEKYVKHMKKAIRRRKDLNVVWCEYGAPVYQDIIDGKETCRSMAEKYHLSEKWIAKKVKSIQQQA